MNELDVRTVLIRGLPIFRCSVCKAEGVGSTTRIALHTLDPVAVEHAITNVDMSHLPEGWACYGNSDARCPAHASQAV